MAGILKDISEGLSAVGGVLAAGTPLIAALGNDPNDPVSQSNIDDLVGFNASADNAIANLGIAPEPKPSASKVAAMTKGEAQAVYKNTLSECSDAADIAKNSPDLPAARQAAGVKANDPKLVKALAASVPVTRSLDEVRYNPSQTESSQKAAAAVLSLETAFTQSHSLKSLYLEPKVITGTYSGASTTSRFSPFPGGSLGFDDTNVSDFQAALAPGVSVSFSQGAMPPRKDWYNYGGASRMSCLIPNTGGFVPGVVDQGGPSMGFTAGPWGSRNYRFPTPRGIGGHAEDDQSVTYGTVSLQPPTPAGGAKPAAISCKWLFSYIDIDFGEYPNHHEMQKHLLGSIQIDLETKIARRGLVAYGGDNINHRSGIQAEPTYHMDAGTGGFIQNVSGDTQIPQPVWFERGGPASLDDLPIEETTVGTYNNHTINVVKLVKETGGGYVVDYSESYTRVPRKVFEALEQHQAHSIISSISAHTREVAVLTGIANILTEIGVWDPKTGLAGAALAPKGVADFIGAISCVQGSGSPPQWIGVDGYETGSARITIPINTWCDTDAEEVRYMTFLSPGAPTTGSQKLAACDEAPVGMAAASITAGTDWYDETNALFTVPFDSLKSNGVHDGLPAVRAAQFYTRTGARQSGRTADVGIDGSGGNTAYLTVTAPTGANGAIEVDPTPHSTGRHKVMFSAGSAPSISIPKTLQEEKGVLFPSYTGEESFSDTAFGCSQLFINGDFKLRFVIPPGSSTTVSAIVEKDGVNVWTNAPAVLGSGARMRFTGGDTRAELPMAIGKMTAYDETGASVGNAFPVGSIGVNDALDCLAGEVSRPEWKRSVGELDPSFLTSYPAVNGESFLHTAASLNAADADDPINLPGSAKAEALRVHLLAQDASS